MRKPSLLSVLLASLCVTGLLAGCGSADSFLGVGGTPPDGGTPPVGGFDHALHFASNPYEGTSTCLTCHAQVGAALIQTGHWNWQGTSTGIDGREDEVHGKTDLINNFCIAILSNEGRCTQCHIGYGWKDKTFDFSDAEALDCLVCHDQTGTYKKSKTEAGAPEAGVDLQAVAASVGEDDGQPGRENCGACHFYAGGGDNVKHGDLCATLVDTTREFDVHMATDGEDFACQECHGVIEHGIGGMSIHSTTEGDMQLCADCHGENPHPQDSPVQGILSFHGFLSCQTCHIPMFSRSRETKVEWYWSEAGDQMRTPVLDDDDRPDYDVKKGEFVWAKNVRPTWLYHDGKWDRAIVNEADAYTETPVVLAKPSAEWKGSGAKIYPFKRMIGDQVVDPLTDMDPETGRVMVPHLFGEPGGSNPYWTEFDWDLALQDGSAYAGQPYSGTYDFVGTVMFLSLNHEVAPKEFALGNDGCCADCHGPTSWIDWDALGRPGGDPVANPQPCD